MSDIELVALAELEIDPSFTLGRIRALLERLNSILGIKAEQREMMLFLSYSKPSSLQSAPQGTHDFAEGWLMAKAMLQVGAHLAAGGVEQVERWFMWERENATGRLLTQKGTVEI